jgi:hypothetical protein
VFIFQAPIVHNDRNGEIREEHPSVRIIIEDLMSGVEYNFQVYVVSHNLISDEYFFIARTMPLIQSEIFIVSGLDPHEKNSIESKNKI